MNIQKLILDLYAIGAVKFGSFTLKSGMQSPIYLDLRMIISYPKLLKEICTILWEKIENLHCDLICGVPYTALPIASCLSVAHDIPMILRRKEMKDYGTRKMVEGVFQKGQTCLVVEDLITSGISVLETIESLEKEGLQVRDVVVIMNREQGGKEDLEKKGYFVHCLFGMEDLLQILLAEKKIDSATYESVAEFIKNSRPSFNPPKEENEPIL